MGSSTDKREWAEDNEKKEHKIYYKDENMKKVDQTSGLSRLA